MRNYAYNAKKYARLSKEELVQLLVTALFAGFFISFNNWGVHEVDMARLEGGTVEDERLQLPQTVFSMPALLPFPDRSAMLLGADGPGRQAAVDVLQAVMLRMLTSMPVGRVIFSIRC